MMMMLVIAHGPVLLAQLESACGLNKAARLVPVLKPAYLVDFLGTQYQAIRLTTAMGDEAVMTA